MNQFGLIIAMALGAYAVRLGGLYLARVPLPPFVQRALGSVPVALFAALVVVSLPGQQNEGAIRLIAVLGAAVALWAGRQLWVGLLIGMGLFWLLRAVSGL